MIIDEELEEDEREEDEDNKKNQQKKGKVNNLNSRLQRNGVLQ
jgi:hypothetical protein